MKMRQRLFILKGGEYTLAISKERKKEIVAEYQEWLDKSQAVIMTNYIGLTMKDMDALRKKVREAGGEFHILKNTLGKLAVENAGLPLVEDHFEATTAAGFAFEDGPALAKAMTDFAKEVEFLKIKGGYLESQPVSSAEIIALAELPPLPVMRAQLLSMMMAPANQLARTLAEPARQLATVLQSYADQDAPEAAA
jgi:large subunit ribosomal protein L10